jgi:hypothetical protein
MVAMDEKRKENSWQCGKKKGRKKKQKNSTKNSEKK